jgi:DNA helicase HerA-like ATPase
MPQTRENFVQHMQAGYVFKQDSVCLGAGIYKEEVFSELPVSLSLKMMNRHGLISGATGTGKTKTIQQLVEHFSTAGVPVLLMDIKGDLSGFSVPGNKNEKIISRQKKIGIPYKSESFPVEYFSLSDAPGVKLKSTVTEFGPILFSKILDLNNTQSGIISVLFKYCDDQHLPLLDLKDVKKTLNYMMGDEKKSLEKEYGQFSSSSVGSIIRKVLALEQQGGDKFFGEKSFDVADLLNINSVGKGKISILKLTDIQSQPNLFSSFMLSLLDEIYSNFPEAGDQPKPKLMIFIDEAHLFFEEASKPLLKKLNNIIKLIRSKSVGIVFCTQTSQDIPAKILGQLGFKIQHALRAFTALDRKKIKLTAQNYGKTDFYSTEELLTRLGIGEAIITGLNEKGTPTPMVHTLLNAPHSKMTILTEQEQAQVISQSALISKYNTEINSESAYEILTKKMAQANSKKEVDAIKKNKTEKTSWFQKITNNKMVRKMARLLFREVCRGVLGTLKARK